MVTFVPPEAPGDERGALLAFVEAQRGAVRRSVLGLTEEQAASRPGVSGLSLSGLLKHVAEMELNWLRMAQQQPNDKERDERTWADGFRLIGGETVPDVLEEWSKTAAETEAFIRSGIDGMDDTFPLPEAPWFPPGTRCSMRWMLIHLVEEIGRHAGHADILRETLDGRSALELVAEEAGYAGRN
ncbi:DinB family protein [Streptomyces nitrosporeus]|uniref:DinB family protein n=1 Tax=Streptomyces nitrosporeus TaxID=28894 RepID=UPI0039A2B31D